MVPASFPNPSNILTDIDAAYTKGETLPEHEDSASSEVAEVMQMLRDYLVGEQSKRGVSVTSHLPALPDLAHSSDGVASILGSSASPAGSTQTHSETRPSPIHPVQPSHFPTDPRTSSDSRPLSNRQRKRLAGLDPGKRGGVKTKDPGYALKLAFFSNDGPPVLRPKWCCQCFEKVRQICSRSHRSIPERQK